LGVAASALVALQTVLGVRWFLKWVGRKMIEPDDSEQVFEKRLHARSWTRE
jgi:hypothetical protein